MYRCLKLFIGFCIRQFFSAIRLKGSPLEEGPVLLVANHPNQALDSLVVGSVLKRDLWFLAKASLFKNPLFSRFFYACHMLPVQRRGDNPDGNIDNRDTFRAAVKALCNNSAVVIFPEGTSMGERRLWPIKTGTARIAFQAEEGKDFKLGLRIQPVGLTYSELESFRSSVTVTFAEPIIVADLKSEFERDAMEAVRLLTGKIESGIRSVTVELQDLRHSEMVEKIAAIYRMRINAPDDQDLMHTIAQNVEALRDGDAVRARDLENRIKDYSELASLFSVDGTVVLDKEVNELWIMLLSPFIVLALILNIVPYRLVGSAARRVSDEPVYVATNKFAFGILFFTVWYLLVSLLAGFLSGSFLVFAGALIICTFCGYYLNNYLPHVKIFLLSHLWPGKKKPVDLLRMMRDQLIQELNSLRIK